MKYLISVFCMLWLCSCQSLSPSFEQPTATITAIQMRSSDPLSPVFALSLRIVNPNNFALPISGVSYVIALNDIDVISGVTNNIPKINAYGDVIVPIDVRLDMLQAARLFLSIPKNGEMQNIAFRLKAKLDLNGLWPSVNIVEEGVIPTKI